MRRRARGPAARASSAIPGPAASRRVQCTATRPRCDRDIAHGRAGPIRSNPIACASALVCAMYAVGSSASSSGAYGHTSRFSHAETSVVRAMGSTATATSRRTQTGGVMRFAVRRRLRPRAPVEVLEARELLQEGEPHGPGGPVALLADDDLGQTAVLVGGFVLLLAVDEH